MQVEHRLGSRHYITACLIDLLAMVHPEGGCLAHSFHVHFVPQSIRHRPGKSTRLAIMLFSYISELMTSGVLPRSMTNRGFPCATSIATKSSVGTARVPAVPSSFPKYSNSPINNSLHISRNTHHFLLLCERKTRCSYKRQIESLVSAFANLGCCLSRNESPISPAISTLDQLVGGPLPDWPDLGLKRSSPSMPGFLIRNSPS